MFVKQHKIAIGTGCANYDLLTLYQLFLLLRDF